MVFCIVCVFQCSVDMNMLPNNTRISIQFDAKIAIKLHRPCFLHVQFKCRVSQKFMDGLCIFLSSIFRRCCCSFVFWFVTGSEQSNQPMKQKPVHGFPRKVHQIDGWSAAYIMTILHLFIPVRQ